MSTMDGGSAGTCGRAYREARPDTADEDDLRAALTELRGRVENLAWQFERDQALGYTHSLTAYIAERLRTLVATDEP